AAPAAVALWWPRGPRPPRPSRGGRCWRASCRAARRTSGALADEWQAFEHGGAEFDVKVAEPAGGHWAELLAAALPPALRGAPGGGALVERTLREAELVVETFRLAARASAPDAAPPQLRVRLASLQRPQCPRLHWDDVPLRAVAALTGPGTEVLPEEAVDRGALARLSERPLEEQVEYSPEAWNEAISRGPGPLRARLLQAPTGWVTLLKGSAWPGGAPLQGPAPGAMHRSPSGAAGARRVVVQVDLAEAVAPSVPGVAEVEFEDQPPAAVVGVQ
ncbi:unnamed protein product, partial [Prorocentrum cordatum]